MSERLGFRLGDFTFVHPSVNAPLSRFDGPRRRIRGAIPPTYLRPYVREAALPGPADALSDGRFCGHGEPTFALFDVALRDETCLELGLQDPNGTERGVCVRPRGGDDSSWVLLARDSFAFTDLAEASTKPTKPVTPLRQPDGAKWQGSVAIGFEYPPDCGSENEATWVAIAAAPEGELHPIVLYDCELQ